MRYLKKYQKGRIFEQDELEAQDELETQDVEEFDDVENSEAPDDIFTEFATQLQEALGQAKECVGNCQSGEEELDSKISAVGEEAVKLGEVMLWSVQTNSPNINIICDAGTTVLRMFAEVAAEGGFQEVATACIYANQEYERATGDLID